MDQFPGVRSFLSKLSGAFPERTVFRLLKWLRTPCSATES